MVGGRPERKEEAMPGDAVRTADPNEIEELVESSIAKLFGEGGG